MKNGYAMVRRLKLTPFELRVAIEALNAKRLNQKAHGIDNGSQKVTITTQDWDDVVIPAGGTNLVYFKWKVPAGLNGKTVYMECTVNADRCRTEYG